MSSAPESGPCFRCGDVCTDDSYCFGCRAFVCGGCDKSHGELFGSHQKEEHLKEPEEDDG